MPYINLFLYYLIFINVLSFLLCIYDKYAAKKGFRRISERTLMWSSVLGGSVVMFVTMRLIRHKTLHKKFMIGIPIIIFLQIAVVMFLRFTIDKWL